MPAEGIGIARSKIGNSYEVKYDRATEWVYASYSLWIEIGRASIIADALIKAHEFCSTNEFF